MIYLKLIGAALALGAVLFAAIADYSAGKKAGQDAVQTAWDKDKAAIQATADAAIAQATKERDAATAANEGIASDYQIKLDAANANAADFARRMRNALASLAASGSTVPKAGDNPGTAATGTPSSAQQLGQLASLVTGLRTECKANADQLDGLIAEIKPQL